MFKITIIFKIVCVAIFFIAAFGLIGARFHSTPSSDKDPLLITDVAKRSFDVKVTAVGNLEASRSHIISSAIRGDLGKLIFLVPEGARVNKGDLLVKMDPTPFEEAITILQEKVRAKENALETSEKGLEWEKSQVAFELKSAEYEVETAELELNRILKGDGPQEISKLQSAMAKAEFQYQELEGYMEDLVHLEEEGFINDTEIKQAQRKYDEEKDVYQNAKLQYESYINYIHPMQVKKAETALKRAVNHKEELVQAGEFRITKALSQLNLARQELADLQNHLNNAKQDLLVSEIRAPTQGMVIHKEEFRSGQRRKPRIGDVLIKNQAILDLPDLDSLTVKTRVREVELCKIQLGYPATIKVDAYPNLVLTGHVSAIGVLALSDPAFGGEEKFFEVIVALNTGDMKLRPGMTSRIVIHAAHVADAVTVPIHAIFEYAKQPYCHVLENGQFVIYPIEVGHCNEEWAEITSGIEVGQHVSLTQPAHDLIDDPNRILGKK